MNDRLSFLFYFLILLYFIFGFILLFFILDLDERYNTTQVTKYNGGMTPIIVWSYIL